MQTRFFLAQARFFGVQSCGFLGAALELFGVHEFSTAVYVYETQHVADPGAARCGGATL